MNEAGITLEFYDIGYPTSQGPCGALSGTFDIDRDGTVNSILVYALANGKADMTFRVPSGSGPFFGDADFARKIAEQIEAQYRDEIEHARWDMDVSAREQEWQPREAAE